MRHNLSCSESNHFYNPTSHNIILEQTKSEKGILKVNSPIEFVGVSTQLFMLLKLIQYLSLRLILVTRRLLIPKAKHIFSLGGTLLSQELLNFCSSQRGKYSKGIRCLPPSCNDPFERYYSVIFRAFFLDSGKLNDSF